MAFSASWMARCIMAYIRDSWSGSSPGEMHAAIAALPAFAFQALTASEPGSPGAPRRGATAATRRSPHQARQRGVRVSSRHRRPVTGDVRGAAQGRRARSSAPAPPAPIAAEPQSKPSSTVCTTGGREGAGSGATAATRSGSGAGSEGRDRLGDRRGAASAPAVTRPRGRRTSRWAVGGAWWPPSRRSGGCRVTLLRAGRRRGRRPVYSRIDRE